MKTIHTEKEIIKEAKTVYQCEYCEYENNWPHHVESHQIQEHTIPNRNVGDYWLFYIKTKDEADLIRKWIYGNSPGEINGPGWYDYDMQKNEFRSIDVAIAEQEKELEKQEKKINQLRLIKNHEA